MGIYSERIFPWLIDRTLDTPAINARRLRLLSQAEGEVLEIGFGTGATLPFYQFDKVRRLVVLEPSAGMNEMAARRIAASGRSVEQVRLAGESLPFESERFDTVVTSLTLCSVGDPDRVLAEVRRVLRPRGRFLFLEHVASDDPRRRRWQDRLTPLQKVIGVGCHLNRPTPELVRAAGLDLGETRQEIEPSMPFAPLVPLVEGVATKR